MRGDATAEREAAACAVILSRVCANNVSDNPEKALWALQ